MAVDQLAATGLFGGLDADVLCGLAARTQVVALPAQALLFRQGDPSDDLYLVARGAVRVTVCAEDGRVRYTAVRGPGTVIGEMQMLSGGERGADVHADVDTELLRVPRVAFDEAAARAPEILGRVADLIRRRLRREHLDAILPTLFGPLDERTVELLEPRIGWRHLRRGETVLRRGEVSGGLHVIVSGRVHALAGEGDDDESIVAELTRGETLGELGLLSNEAEAVTFRVARDAEVATLPREAFARLVEDRPGALIALARYALGRAGRRHHRRHDAITAVAVLGATAGTSDFAASLARALSPYGATAHLGSHEVERALGTRGVAQAEDGDAHHLRLGTWLAEREARHRFVVYETDGVDSPWSQRCLRLADHLLVVGAATADPAPGAAERAITVRAGGPLPANRALVLVPTAGAPASILGTERWLAPRAVARVHHVAADSAAGPDRLARLLAGRAIGLALSGGGARAFAHIGVIRALEEATIAVDLVGGTSMGAVVGALHAIGLDARAIADTLWNEFVCRRPGHDYTLPTVGLLRGRRFVRAIRAMFGERRIEDLGVGYFCVSTDLTTAEARIHADGLLWQALRASCALPALAVPSVDRGHVLVDGGIVNNLPGDILRERGAGVLIAVDASMDVPLALPEDVDAMPSPWTILWRRRHRGGTARPVTLIRILDRALTVTSVRHRQRVAAAADLYLKVPVEAFGLMQFTALREIEEAGYRFARERLRTWNPPTIAESSPRAPAP